MHCFDDQAFETNMVQGWLPFIFFYYKITWVIPILIQNHIFESVETGSGKPEVEVHTFWVHYDSWVHFMFSTNISAKKWRQTFKKKSNSQISQQSFLICKGISPFSNSSTNSKTDAVFWFVWDCWFKEDLSLIEKHNHLQFEARKMASTNP